MSYASKHSLSLPRDDLIPTSLFFFLFIPCSQLEFIHLFRGAWIIAHCHRMLLLKACFFFSSVYTPHLLRNCNLHCNRFFFVLLHYCSMSILRMKRNEFCRLMHTILFRFISQVDALMHHQLVNGVLSSNSSLATTICLEWTENWAPVTMEMETMDSVTLHRQQLQLQPSQSRHVYWLFRCLPLSSLYYR